MPPVDPPGESSAEPPVTPKYVLPGIYTGPPLDDPLFIGHLPPSERKAIRDLRRKIPLIYDLGLPVSKVKDIIYPEITTHYGHFYTLQWIKDQTSKEQPLFQKLFERYGNHLYRVDIGEHNRDERGQFGTLPQSFSKLAQLRKVLFKNIVIKSLVHLPSSIKLLNFWNCDLHDFTGCPTPLSHLTNLSVYHSTVCSLEGLPFELPAVETLILEDLPLRSLEWLPRLPRLQRLRLRRCPIRNFAGLTNLLRRPSLSWLFFECGFLSLHGLPRSIDALKNGYLTVVHHFNTTPTDFPASYQAQLELDGTHWTEIAFDGLPGGDEETILTRYYEAFAPSPTDLARRYGAGERLCPFDRDRIVWEGTLATWHVLREAPLARDDPVRTALADQIGVSERVGDFLL